ncbi:hypothetical protein PV733_08785 [Streptomyces europaeiscabiei]|uniref:hypothetical protein n=1 Tax=Streptomyces europaeiscabiei TaxID=146819 RepID=UPI0029A3CABB|nr:hypothetical protein [Streptomyces europaeiscabiei]MDX3709061.1 hypothetical protein [Streptomyces europaeiscabiei]
MTIFNSHDFEAQRVEIAFYTEKAFQISLFYFAGLGAFFALSKSDVMTAVSKFTNLPLSSLAALFVLTVNLVYLVLACACLFAILKRGMFVLKHTSNVTSVAQAGSIHREWEKFVRDESPMGGTTALHSLAWNIDNYYMVPLFVLIVGASVASMWVALTSGSWVTVAFAGILFLLHAIPGYMAKQLAVLNERCRSLL